MTSNAQQQSGVNVSRETLDRLRHYEDLLRKWNPKINLVSKSTIEQIWNRHIADSMQLFRLASGKHWLDLGSGGGFPGCVIAILAHELAPEMKTTLLESDQRKATFLRTVLRETGVAGRVISERIEKAEPVGADVISARALADLETLLGYSDRHLAESGVALFMKGRSWKEELSEAERLWNFEYKAVSSTTQEDAVILRIIGAHRA